MPIPAPRLRRTLRLVLANPCADQLLIALGPGRSRTVPAIPMRGTEHCNVTAARFLRTAGSGWQVRLGSTIGRRTTEPTTGSREQERWLPVRMLTGPTPRYVQLPHGWGGWHSLCEEPVEGDLARAVELAQGYWKGWLPDGLVTLD